MSVRSIGGIYDEGDTRRRRAKTSHKTRVFFRSFLEDVSFLEDGARVGARGERAFSEDAPR